jgi:hypothetical protein
MQDPATGRWQVAAVGPNRGGRHAAPPEHLTGEGLEEETALVDLMLKLRELDKADRLEAVWRRVRLAYYQGAEEQSQRAPPTSDIRGTRARYPGHPRVTRSVRGPRRVST